MSYPELLKKYNIPGPRYTTYPTVPYWSETPTQDQWLSKIENELKEAEKKDLGAALYVHIPFCESLCTYCACNTRITRNHKVEGPYVKSVLKEWGLYLKHLGRAPKIGDIHLGGGTPTFLPPAQLRTLIEGLLVESELSPHAEFSVEADPRVTTSEHLQVLYDIGFRRLSLGVQDFDPEVQKIVHRVQSEEQVKKLTDEARDLGYSGINYDLIYGLPKQTLASVERTISAVRALKPDRIAFYSYAHVPWIRPGQRRFTEADLPSGDEKRALYELGRQGLEAEGYVEVGMDHFALRSDSLLRGFHNGTLHRNLMGYIPRHVSPLIGLGVSAIGDAWSAFSQNEKVVETYQARVEKGEIPILRGHVLTEEDQVLRRHILNLMTKGFTEWSLPESKTEYLSTVNDKLHEMVQDGLVELTETSCRITPQGWPFLRNTCMAFDARLAEKSPGGQLFSKTI